MTWNEVASAVELLTADAPPDPVTMRGDRGFFGYADLTDDDGNRVQVYQSSAIGDGPEPGLSFVWLAIGASESHTDIHAERAAAHLDREQAGRVARALLTWLAQVEEGEGRADG